MRLKSCPYCGKIHSGECRQKPKKKAQKKNDVRKFRSSGEWQHKRQEILERDKYCCVVCKAQGIINASKSHEVHHIIPLANNFELRCEDTNLITLCEHHHKLIHQNIISNVDIQELVNTMYAKK